MRHQIRRCTKKPVFAALAAATLLLAGCGGKQSMASKSAAAFREAAGKGAPVGEPSHGGHAATPGGSATTPADHTGMSEMEHSATPGTDKSTMSGMGHAEAGMQHEKAPHGQHDMKMSSEASATPMDDGAMQHGMQHGETTSPAEGMAEVRPEEAHPGRPSSKLAPDSLDAPAPTSVSDAARSAEDGVTRPRDGARRVRPPGRGPRIRTDATRHARPR
jgi:hypothetical protein